MCGFYSGSGAATFSGAQAHFVFARATPKQQRAHNNHDSTAQHITTYSACASTATSEKSSCQPCGAYGGGGGYLALEYLLEHDRMAVR